MNSLNPEDLISRVENALETMCFVMADSIPTDEVDEMPSLQTWILFKNENECGCLELAASFGFVQEVGSGLLGIDTEDIQEGEQAQGVLLELANVIAGEIISLLGGEETFFELGIPTSSPSNVDVPTEHIAVAFDSMGELLYIDVERGMVNSQADAA